MAREAPLLLFAVASRLGADVAARWYVSSLVIYAFPRISNSYAQGCRTAEQASQLGCAYPPADADAAGGAEPPRWHRQRLSKIRSGDCTAVAGLWYASDGTGFSVGTHYWEISSSLLPQHSHGESGGGGESGASVSAAADRPSFAVGVVSSDRLPGKIFLGSEPSSGSLGYGLAYLGSRAALLRYGEKEPYLTHKRALHSSQKTC